MAVGFPLGLVALWVATCRAILGNVYRKGA
jgi:hypothetical protein